MPLTLSGVIVPAITPRIASAIDTSSITRLMAFLIDGGVDSMFILGTTGEFQHLATEQKRQVISHSITAINNRVPVLVGISAQTLEETLVLVKTAEEFKAQALVLAPMFGEESPEGQIDAVIESTRLPVVLYNNPAIHGNISLPLALIEKAASQPGIIGIKDSSGDKAYFQKLLALQSARFRVYQGHEGSILSSLEGGASGIVPGMANIAPQLCKDLWLRRDQATMDQLMALKAEIKRLFPSSISGYKQRLIEMGILK